MSPSSSQSLLCSRGRDLSRTEETFKESSPRSVLYDTHTNIFIHSLFEWVCFPHSHLIRHFTYHSHPARHEELTRVQEGNQCKIKHKAKSTQTFFSPALSPPPALACLPPPPPRLVKIYLTCFRMGQLTSAYTRRVLIACANKNQRIPLAARVVQGKSPR